MDGGFVTLPKAEVHVHLEGCFEVDDIVRLARENGVQLPRPRDRLLEFGGAGRVPPIPRLDLRAGAHA